MATVGEWIDGARLRTLPAAAAPVLIGTGAAFDLDAGSIPRAVLAAGVALSLQVGVNYANDYSDGLRGTDDVRHGPQRLTGSGAASPRAVRAAAFAAFGVAAVLGLVLCALAGTWWLLAVGALCVVAAWFYTGGRRPYGYRGLGEIGVFIFFGLVAVLGTTYTQALAISWQAVVGATGVGLIACALLMVNNIRDLPSDREAGKLTLAVRLGDRAARRAFVVLLVVPLVLVLPIARTHPAALGVLVLAVPVWLVSRRVLGGASRGDLMSALRNTGLIELAYGLLLGAALAL